jgi:hypothetical protein
MIKPHQLFNLKQLIRQKLGMRPALCYYPSRLCPEGCEPNQTFQCEKCKRYVPYCWGCHDEYFNLCNECYPTEEEK